MKGKFHGSMCVMSVVGMLAVSGCGGGSDPGGSIDLVQYLIPQSNVVISYNDYSIDDGIVSDAGPYDSTWQVFSDSAILNNGGDDIQLSYDASRVYIDGVDYDYSFPRNFAPGRIYSNSYGDRIAAFGPFDARTFSVGASGPTYDAENVIILVTRIDFGVDSDIRIEYFVEGEAMVGSRSFELCPATVPLNPDHDYESICDPLSFAGIRVD